MTDRDKFFPTVAGETEDHRELRRQLWEAEIDLRERVEAVAELRRKLPRNPVREDYRFVGMDAGGARRAVAMSELFTEGRRSLVVVHFMFKPFADNPCPMCTAWADGYDAVARHVEQRAAFVLVAKAPVERFVAHGEGRGWSRHRLLSSEGSAFNRDYGMEDADENQLPGVSTFVRDDDGTVRHFYTANAMLDGQGRGLDLLTPIWSMFDLLPEGRGEFFPRLRYGG